MFSNAKWLVLLLASLIVVGCSTEGSSDQTPANSGASTNQTVKNEKTTTDTEQLTTIQEMVVQKHGPAITNFSAQELTDIDGATFGNFVFKKDGVPHEGVIYGTMINNKWSIQQLEVAQTDTKAPVTIMEVAGLLKEQGDRSYRILSGVINDHRIRAIKIEYGGSIGTTLIKIGAEQNMFMDVQLGFSGGIKSFSALDANNKVIFERK